MKASARNGDTIEELERLLNEARIEREQLIIEAKEFKEEAKKKIRKAGASRRVVLAIKKKIENLKRVQKLKPNTWYKIPSWSKGKSTYFYFVERTPAGRARGVFLETNRYRHIETKELCHIITNDTASYDDCKFYPEKVISRLDVMMCGLAPEVILDLARKYKQIVVDGRGKPILDKDGQPTTRCYSGKDNIEMA